MPTALYTRKKLSFWLFFRNVWIDSESLLTDIDSESLLKFDSAHFGR